MEHLHDSIGSNRFVVRLFILVFACNIAFEANAPHMAETFHKEAVRADAIVDFQNLIGQQLHREQFCERMLFDLLCKFHCSVRGVSLIPHCIAAGGKTRSLWPQAYFHLPRFSGTGSDRSAMWEARAAWDTISVQLLLGHQIER